MMAQAAYDHTESKRYLTVNIVVLEGTVEFPQ